MNSYDIIQDTDGKFITSLLAADDTTAKENFISSMGYDLTPKLDDEDVKEFTLHSNEDGWDRSFLSNYYDTALQEALSLLGYSMFESDTTLEQHSTPY